MKHFILSPPFCYLYFIAIYIYIIVLRVRIWTNHYLEIEKLQGTSLYFYIFFALFMKLRISSEKDIIVSLKYENSTYIITLRIRHEGERRVKEM